MSWQPLKGFMNGLNSKLKNYKTQAEKIAFGDGFWYAWELADEQTKVVIESKDHEIDLLRKQAKANTRALSLTQSSKGDALSE